MPLLSRDPRVKPEWGVPLDLFHAHNQAVVGCWPLSEGMGTLVTGGRGSNGVLVSGLAWGPGEMGVGLNCDGTNKYLRVTAGVQTALGATGSIRARFLCRTLATGGAIISKRSSNVVNTGFDCTMRQDGTGKFVLQVGNGTSTQTWSPTYAIAAKLWYDAVFTWDGSNLRLFVNGIQQATTAQTSAHANLAGADLYSGAAWSGQAEPFDGIVESLWFYRDALPAGLVSDLYARPYAGWLAGTTRRLWPVSVSVVTTDTGSALDAALTTVAETLADLGAGVDLPTVGAALAAADVGSATDAVTRTAAFDAADLALGLDQGTISAAVNAAGETAAGVDAFAIAAALAALSETGAGADAASVATRPLPHHRLGATVTD